MKLAKLKSIADAGMTVLKANRPELLLGAAVGAGISAIVLAARGGYVSGVAVTEAEVDRVLRKCDEKTVVDYEKNVLNPDVALTVKEKASLTWLNYLPAAAAGIGMVGLTSSLHVVHMKDKKHLAAAAMMAIDELKSESRDIREKAMRVIADDSKTVEEKKAALEEATESSPWTSEVFPESATYLCVDDYSNRPFESNRDLIRRAGEVLVMEVMRHGKANLNLFYSELGVSDSQMGHSVGWTREDIAGYGGTNGLDFVAFGLTELPNGKPAISCWFREPPTSDYLQRAQS